MLLEDLFARMDRKGHVGSADNESAAIVGGLDERANILESKRLPPSRRPGSRRRLYKTLVARWLTAFKKQHSNQQES